MIIKLLGAEVSIATANNVANAGLVRIVTTGAAAVVNVAYSNGVVYANATVTNTMPMFLIKNNTDLVQGGAATLAVPIAYRG